MLRITLIALLSTLISCASGNCRENRANKPLDSAEMMEKEAKMKADNPLDVVKVYKYDGSLQCGMGKAKNVNEMQGELKSIKVLSAEKKADGLMRIQVCGSPTGQANVYEINRTDLAAAKKLGFKEWVY